MFLVHPSLDLLPIESERKFSHISVGPPDATHREVQTDSLSIHVSRDLYTQEDIDVMYGGPRDVRKKTVRDKVLRCVKDTFTCNVQKGLAILQWLLSWMPIIPQLRYYNLKKLVGMCIWIFYT